MKSLVTCVSYSNNPKQIVLLFKRYLVEWMNEWKVYSLKQIILILLILLILSTLNVCLGLKHKKFEIGHLLTENKIDVMCLQETEVEKCMVKINYVRCYV